MRCRDVHTFGNLLVKLDLRVPGAKLQETQDLLLFGRLVVQCFREGKVIDVAHELDERVLRSFLAKLRLHCIVVVTVCAAESSVMWDIQGTENTYCHRSR